MFRIVTYTVTVSFLLLFIGCGVSNKKARKDLMEYLDIHHKDKYTVVTFKRNFNTVNMNPNLFGVELELIENPNVLIDFQWDAKNKKLYIPPYNRKNVSINYYAGY